MTTAATVTMILGTAATATVTAGSSNRANPGSAVTIALLSTTGIKRWILREDGTDYINQKGFVYQSDLGGAFSTSFTLPQQQCVIPMLSSTWDGNQEVRERFKILNYANAIGIYHRAAAVIASNVNTANISVSVDGQTLVAGQYVLCAAQTTAADNGLYCVGTVTAGYAPLTRAPDLQSGWVVPSPQIVEVESGTLYGGTTWKSSATGNLTIGTTSVNFYPRVIRGTGAFASNTLNVTSQFVQTGASAVASMTNTVNAIQCAAPVAGAGSGYCVFTTAAAGGTGAFAYKIQNWG